MENTVMTRIRQQTTFVQGGRALNVGTTTWTEQGNVVHTSDRCEDEILLGDCHPLDVKHYAHSAPILNCPTLSRALENWVADQFYSGFNYGSRFVFPDEPSSSVAATRAVARCSPSRPYVDVPANILELADISRLLKLTMQNSLLKVIANNNLRFWFGIMPLVGDLAKLTNFNEQVDRRVRIMKKLASSKGYRRTIKFWDSSHTRSLSKLVNNRNDAISIVGEQSTKTSVNVHCRFVAAPHNTLWDLESPEEMRMLARRAVLGLSNPTSIDMLASAWEAFPFSWLMDWCGTIGDYLGSQRNIIPATLAVCTVTRHMDVTWNFPTFTSGRGTIVPPSTWTSTEILRSRQTPSITAHFPFLDGKQLGILASLAIMRS
jgi:hypothetical protein